MFGIGYMASDFAKPHRVSNPKSFSQPSKGPRQGSRQGSRSMRGGPFLGSIEQFSDQLDLSEDQKKQIDQLLQNTMAKADERQREIRELFHSTRKLVDEILSEEQLAKLKELKEQRWRDFIQSEITQDRAWFKKNGVDSKKEPLIRTALNEFHDQIRKSLRKRSRGPRPKRPEQGPAGDRPDRPKSDAMGTRDGAKRDGPKREHRHRSRPSFFAEAEKQRNKKLTEIVGSDLAKAFASERGRFGRR